MLFERRERAERSFLLRNILLGAVVTVAMRWLVVPLGHAVFPSATLASNANFFAAHILSFGIPIAYVTARIRSEPARRLRRFEPFFDRYVIEEQELAPLVGQRIALHLNPRDILRLARLALQLHVRFGRRAIVLAVVTAHAGADEVLPGRGAAPRLRHDVIDRHQSVALLAAILAGVIVADQHVRSSV